MKKLTLHALILMLIVISSLSFSACAKPYVGEFYFNMLTMDMGGVTITVKAGEELLGDVIEPDMMTLTVNEDGTAVIVVVDEITDTSNYTWEKGEGDTIIFTSVDEPEEPPITATYNKEGITMDITIDEASMTITFTKTPAETSSNTSSN